MFTVDVQECATSYVCLTCTSIDVVQVTGIDINGSLSACIAGITATIYITTYQNLRLRLLP